MHIVLVYINNDVEDDLGLDQGYHEEDDLVMHEFDYHDDNDVYAQICAVTHVHAVGNTVTDIVTNINDIVVAIISYHFIDDELID